MLCGEDDLKEAGMALGPRKKLLNYIEERKASSENKLSGLEEYQRSAVTSDVKYVVGPAGTGQPSVNYPRLCFEPSAFYALGSPIAMFLAVRGIEGMRIYGYQNIFKVSLIIFIFTGLGSNFTLPTCDRFFNVFHPYDPVAYRVESLVSPDFSKLRPVVIPHHKGRKRMHLELKDTVTRLMTGDISKRIIEGISSTLSSVYNIATGTNTTGQTADEQAKAALEDSIREKALEDDAADANNPRTLDSKLNGGRRIDHVLQEAPHESFNEYLFALAAHLCYWESEDTCLLIVKDIYAQMGIAADDEQIMPGSNSVPYLNTAANPPVLEKGGNPPPPTFTAPTLINGQLVTPNLNQQQQTTLTPMAPPPPQQPTFLSSPAGPPPPMTPVIGPPPTLMTPSPLGPPACPPSISGSTMQRTTGYPKPSAYPTTTPQSASGRPAVMGMDPTAPLAENKPIAPPPMAGFVRKN